MKELPEQFPPGADIDYENPGIRLYGLRFYIDQTPVEYVAEFMMVLFATKTIGDKSFGDPLPEIALLRNWPSGEHLYYASVPIRLLLKLFAFCSKTSIDKRHEVHEQKYKNLLELLSKKIKVGVGNKTEVIDALEELFAGLLGEGAERNWCARTFSPLAECLLSQEVISRDRNIKQMTETKAKLGEVLGWNETINDINTYYRLSSHMFLARGGEELYLQLCNLFAQSPGKIKKWTCDIGLAEYTDINKLHKSLNDKLSSLRESQIIGLKELVNYIEELDDETQKLTNKERQRRMECGWCPEETWPETLFFAMELDNLLSANLDPVERVEQLKYACSLQVLRTLCAQSLRYVCDYRKNYRFAQAPLGYLWLMTPVEADNMLKVFASSNLIKITDIIYNSLRHPKLVEWEKEASTRKANKKNEDLYKQADEKHGHLMFLSLAKSMELIMPRRGPGARFVMNDKLVRYLVSSLLRPGEQVEYRDFLRRMYMHYGMAIEGDELLEAIEWSGHPRPTVQPNHYDWFQDLLRRGGFFIELSDACSIVQNPFSGV